jgi:hypothetical protein
MLLLAVHASGICRMLAAAPVLSMSSDTSRHTCRCMPLASNWTACLHSHTCKREAGRGVFYLLFLLAYALTVPLTLLTCNNVYNTGVAGSSLPSTCHSGTTGPGCTWQLLPAALGAAKASPQKSVSPPLGNASIRQLRATACLINLKQAVSLTKDSGLTQPWATPSSLQQCSQRDTKQHMMAKLLACQAHCAWPAHTRLPKNAWHYRVCTRQCKCTPDSASAHQTVQMHTNQCKCTPCSAQASRNAFYV